MARIFRWSVRLLTGAVLLGLATVALLYWFAGRSVPDYDTTLRMEGISDPVEIVRDNANVPHVFGASDADVFFGLGVAHAQDRLWQMMFLRRAVQGRLAELFGLRAVDNDELLRRLDLYPLAVESVRHLDDDARLALEAYASGVNAWLEEVNTGARGRGAPEYWVFPPDIAPWTPADSVAILKLMALNLSAHASFEILRGRVSLRLGDDARLADILPDAPGDPVAVLPEYASLFPDAPRHAAVEPRDPDLITSLPARGLGGASNAWAAAPSRSASGGTLLANDPHLAFTAPSIWYLARLELSSGGVIGATIPGVPAVLLGRSDRIAWGLTSSYLDDQDIHIERLNPDNPAEVLAPDGYVPLRSRESIIRIRDAAPLTITLRWSENGPILPNHQLGLAGVVQPGHVAALGWTALDPRDTSIAAALSLMRAGDVDAAIAAGAGFVAPSQNLTVIDRERIAMKTIGAMPRRAANHDTQGRLPSRGWLPQNRWQGRLPYSDNPEFVDPEGGIVGNTNNKFIDRPFPRHVSFDWGDTQRVERWRELMQNREVHTRDSFIEAQLDTVSFTARSLLFFVGAELWFSGEPAPAGTAERRRHDALRLLADWNGEMNEHMPEPLIYSAWMRALQDRLIRDDLGGDIADEFSQLEPVFIERVFRDIDGAAVWCDIRRTTPVETCADIASLSLDDALLWLDEHGGSDLTTLRWGDAHEARHDHPVLGAEPVIGFLVNLRQSTSGGDHTLMKGASSGRGEEPFQSVHGAGYRGVYDMADPDSSVFIIATGQSGHPLSRHYDDLGDLWRRGEYIPMSLDPDLARAASVGVTRIEPR